MSRSLGMICLELPSLLSHHSPGGAATLNFACRAACVGSILLPTCLPKRATFFFPASCAQLAEVVYPPQEYNMSKSATSTTPSLLPNSLSTDSHMGISDI